MSFDPEFLAEGAESPVLGPAYFDARATVERFMKPFEDQHFKPLMDKFADEFREKLWGDVCAWLLADTESNLQSEIWRMVDSSVEAILGGEQWPLQKYALGDRYDCAKVRATVAKLIPEELQNMRIAELEAQLAQANEVIQRYRERF